MRGIVWVVAVGLFAGAVSADQVIFNNGDRLSGTIKSTDGDKLTITTVVAGDVVVDFKDVKSFSTDGPVTLHLKDGTVLQQRVTANPEGGVTTAEGPTVKSQSVPLSAITKVNPAPVKWTGSVMASAIVTRGNSYGDAANVEADAVRRAEDDRITLRAAYSYARTENGDGEKTTSTDNWFAFGKYDYFFTPKWYGYASGRLERDHIANLDLRLTPSAGLGYQWIESSRLNFNTEGGLAWVYERYTDPDTTRDYVAARLAYHVDYQLNDKVKLFHNLEYLPSLEDLGTFLINADAGIRAMLSKNFFMEAKVALEYNSEPAENAHETDVRYILGVGWTF